ncbi:putative Histidine kinase [Seiridium cardinale]|uniref:Histidine kinase n=1 Tax=Seiridium cardinale TaxID=138064 RepID=A0ABR2Y284_9PEZI
MSLAAECTPNSTECPHCDISSASQYTRKHRDDFPQGPGLRHTGSGDHQRRHPSALQFYTRCFEKNAFFLPKPPRPIFHSVPMMGDTRATLEDVLLDVFQGDPRPTFIVQLPQDTARPSAIAFSNPALKADASLHDAVLEVIKSREDQFWTWILGETDIKGGLDPNRPASYRDSYWTRSVFRGEYVIVACNEQQRPTTPQRPGIRHNDHSHTLLKVPAEPGSGPVQEGDEEDFTVPGLTPEQEEPFVLTVNSFDWSSTPLGPMPQWPAQLQQTFNQILADSRPIALYWGDSLTTLYNEAFAKLWGAKHPGLLGKPLKDAWPDFSDKIQETMHVTTTKRRASQEEEWRFFIEKADGSLEETYLKWSIVPIVPEKEKENVGFLQPVIDTTKMRLWDRRMKMLIDLGDLLVTARDVKSYWRKMLEALEACEPSYDIPLAILYSVENDSKNLSPSPTKPNDLNSIYQLEGSLGVPKDHPLVPKTLPLESREDGLSLAFREAIKIRTPTVISTRDGTLPEELLHGIHWRGFQDPCHEAIICPIRPTKDERVMGLLVLGLNPRRPYGSEYQQYISLLNQKLTTTLASTVLLEEEARRNRNISEQAAYDRAKLKEKLAVQTKEANEWVSKFQAIAELIPVGMYFSTPEGEISFANDAWHSITGIPKSDHFTQAEFLSRVVQDDRQNVSRAYKEMKDTGTVNLEFRIHRDDEVPLQHPIGSSPAFEKVGLDFISEAPRERYISAALKAEVAPDGAVIRVFACMTDVTLHKKAADAAIRKASQAENLKKLAENASVGMYEMQSDGRLNWANSTFFEMCGLERVDLAKHATRPFESCVVEEDKPLLRQALERLTKKGKKASAEIRLNTLWTEEDHAGNKIVAPRCILASFRPVKNSGGVIETFTGCLVDMTRQRQQFEIERQRKDEAIESKRQQENFIDMTSHEMRNPLSAIVQCADSVVASSSRGEQILKAPTATGDDESLVLNKEAREELLHLLSTCIDNAETIDICAQHQRHIVDDILTMSKMDSDLLAVSSTTVDPRVVANESLKMFEVEARRVDINLTMTIDKGYDDLKIEFLDFDPSRLRQVLINLLTNALKFTKSQATRNVSIRLSASKQRPTDASSSVQYIPHTTDASLILVEQAPPETEVVYLTFEVKDTGQGLTDEEKSSLFQRFVQASPKTHVKYGGSGLGLFISKRLTEMLGGQIGVASRPGHGSTFAFYIAAMVPGEEALQEARATAKTAAPAVLTPVGNGPSKYTLAESPRPQIASTDSLVRGVLIVEDNLINQQITRRGLVDKGYKIEVANHGVEALDKLQQTDRMGGEFPLDVVMMDMEMPIMDGLTCTRNIREMEREGKIRGPRVPIIAVSANARSEQIQEAKSAGCDDVLVKPFKIPELIKVMQRLAKRMNIQQGSPGEKTETSVTEKEEPND